MKVTVIVGTRPEAIKLAPVVVELRKQSLRPYVITTGQHQQMVDSVLSLFGICPDAKLDVMQGGQALGVLMGKLLQTLEGSIPPDTDIVVVQGDTSTALAGAMCAFLKGIKCAHIEAGLRTDSIYSPFPEEYNRRAISIAAQYHFAPTVGAKQNLAREGYTDGVHVVGNTAIDAAVSVEAMGVGYSDALLARVPQLTDRSTRIALVTMHRRENHGEGLGQVMAAVSALAAKYSDVHFVWPVHPNPAVCDVVHRVLGQQPRVHLVEPLDYTDIIALMRRSFCALSDSGGIQEEAPSFHCPVLVLRKETERPEAVECGANVLVGTQEQDVVAAFMRLADHERHRKEMVVSENPYGDGLASNRIVKFLRGDSDLGAAGDKT